MDAFAVCVTFISVILGIAYPIIIQITSNDKYSSDIILGVFDNKYDKKIFLPNLILSLVLIVIYLLKLPPLFYTDITFFDFFIENSALILLCLSTSFLIFNFIRFIGVINTFYRTSSLIKYFVSQKDKVISGKDYTSFDCLADIMYWSIQTQNVNASRPLADYFYDIFQEYRKKSSNQEIIYPYRFYSLIYNIIEKIIYVEKNLLHVIEHRAVSGIWLLGEIIKTHKISESTYNGMWNNLILLVKNDKDDSVLDFWKNSHQFYQFNYNNIYPDYEFNDDGFMVKNQKEIDESEGRRKVFFEFHIALGALLFYTKKHNLLQKIFRYTTSIPPDYILLPKQMSEIYKSYFYFFDPYERNMPWISRKFSFPDFEGLNADRDIKNWICRYLGFLFIRQMNIQSNYTNYDPQSLSYLPRELSEKRFWAENVAYFKKFVNQILENDKETIIEFNYNQNNDFYLTKLDEIEKQIKDDYEQHQEIIEPEQEKVNLFFESSTKILTKTFDDYDLLNNKNGFDKNTDYESFNIQGLSDIVDKEMFAENGITHLNFDTFLAQSVSQKYAKGWFEIFHHHSSNRYTFEQNDVFLAIDKMKLNPENHIIIVFGSFNIDYYINNLKVENLQRNSYNNVGIQYYSGISYNLSSSLFVLNKKDLPFVEYRNIEEDIKTLYQLKPLIQRYNVYATVSDLNTNLELKKELEKDESIQVENLNKSAWQAIVFRTIFKWKKNIKMYQIVNKRIYNERGKTNNIDDIEPI